MLSNLDALQVAALAPRPAPAKLPSKQPRQGPAGPAKTSLTPAQPKLPEPTERKGHNVTRLLCTASGSYPEGKILARASQRESCVMATPVVLSVAGLRGPYHLPRTQLAGLGLRASGLDHAHS